MVASADANRRFSKLLRELLILIGGTLLLSALVTPALYAFFRTFVEPMPWPYSRLFDRVAMVMVLLIVIVRRKQFELSSYRPELMQYLGKPRLSSLLVGFLLSFGASMCVLPLLVMEGVYRWSGHGWMEAILRLAETLPAAALISCIEEVFFRFFLFLSLRRFCGFLPAAMLSSLLYASVHFIQPVKSWDFQELGLATGFSYLSEIFARYGEEGLLPAAFGLFLVGLVLCLTVERSRSLLPALGLHAGWVATTKVIGKIVDLPLGVDYPLGAGRRYFLLTQELTWFAICLVGLLAFFCFGRKKGP